MARCSLVFYECTRGVGSTMDRCIEGAPRCETGAGESCCHPAYVERYALLRGAGFSERSALRAALLGDR